MLKGRSNRDEDMNYFAAYYKKAFAGVNFVDFKKYGHEDSMINELMEDASKVKRVRRFVSN
jgi:hypothetical protein